MILLAIPFPLALYHLSRVCGDDPLPMVELTEKDLFVPRMRG